MTPAVMAEKWNNRALFSLLWPLIIEQILAVTMGAADTMMVSSVGEHAVSAVNIVDNINNLLIIVFIAMSTGGAVVVSQYIGRRDQKNARVASKQLVYVVIILSLFITLFAVVLRRPLIRLIYGTTIESDVMEGAVLYFLITALSYPFLAVYNANAALFRAAGNSKVPMRIAILVNALNIGGNAFLIFVVRIGVMGAALSTLVSRIVAAMITTVMLYRNSSSSISLAGLIHVRFSRPMIRNILNVALPSGLESSMFQVGRLLTQRIFTVFGTSALAANAIATVINSFTFMPGLAYGMALLTIVGQCVGAGDFPEAKKQTAKIIKIAYITLFTISALVYVFMEPIVNLFSLSPEAHDMAKLFLRIHCITLALGWPLSFAIPNALRAAGDARFVMVVATISMWTVRVSAAYLLTFTFGIGPLGVWLAMGGDFVVRSVFYTNRWLSGKWQEKQVITS